MPTVDFTDDEAEAVHMAVEMSINVAPQVKEEYVTDKIIEDAEMLAAVCQTHDDYVDRLETAKVKLEEVK